MPLNLFNNHLTLINKLHFQSIFIALSFRQTYITMILRLSGLFIGVCMFAQLQAQDNQYIVKFNGDTIRGKLQLNLSRDNSLSMLFKAEGENKKNIIPLRFNYVYYDEEHKFRSVAFFNQRLFMQIIKEHKHISYYNYIYKRDNSILNTIVVSKPSGDAFELSGLTFRKQVIKFMKDCPEIVAKLEIKKYRYKDYVKLFADYNDCMETPPPPAVPVVVTTAAVTGTSLVAPASPSTTTMDDRQREKLVNIDEFSQYLSGLTDYKYSKDVSEWISDVTARVTQNRAIPNYLWNSLNAMTEEHPELQDKAKKLKEDLQD